MNAQDLLSWVKAEKARLEDMGRTQGGQYKAILGWLETAERLAAVPDDYVWPKVTYDGTDPRGWAMKVMDADFMLQKYAKFGRPLE